jgi:hypothetical protein
VSERHAGADRLQVQRGELWRETFGFVGPDGTDGDVGA